MQSGSDSTAAGISSQQPASADLAQIQAPGVAATPAGYLPSQLMDMMMAPQGMTRNISLRFLGAAWHGVLLRVGFMAPDRFCFQALIFSAAHFSNS